MKLCDCAQKYFVGFSPSTILITLDLIEDGRLMMDDDRHLMITTAHPDFAQMSLKVQDLEFNFSICLYSVEIHVIKRDHHPSVQTTEISNHISMDYVIETIPFYM